MTNEMADRVKLMMQYQMIDNDLSKGMFGPNLGAPRRRPPPPPPRPPRGPGGGGGDGDDGDGDNGGGGPPPNLPVAQ